MIYSFDYIISYVSKFYTLRAGDLIYTGTPAGVDRVEIGDKVHISIPREICHLFDTQTGARIGD